MTRPPREATDICYEILTLINKKGKILKYELLKNLGSETAFRRWIDHCLLSGRIVECFQQRIGNRTFTYYRKTSYGELFHKVLEHANIVKVASRIIGRKRLKSG